MALAARRPSPIAKITVAAHLFSVRKSINQGPQCCRYLKIWYSVNVKMFNKPILVK